ncbi:MAG: U2 small nuclear RNA auxiliary factor 2 [Marteilia pararefringens]
MSALGNYHNNVGGVGGSSSSGNGAAAANKSSTRQTPTDPRTRARYFSNSNANDQSPKHHNHRPHDNHHYSGSSDSRPEAAAAPKSSHRSEDHYESSRHHHQRRRERDDDRSSHRSKSDSKHSRSSRDKEPIQTLEELGYRSKKYKFFDIPANGFENTQPSEYYSMVENGQLPKLIYVPSSSLSINTEVPWGGCFVNTQAKRLYVGNIPHSTDETEVINFFNSMMEEHSLKSPESGPAVISAQLNLDKNFAFIELRSVEETSGALILDGIQFHGCQLKLRRPRDYQPIQTWSLNGDYTSLPANFQLRAFGGAANENKLFICNLPQSYGQNELRNLLSIYGQVSQCEIIKDGNSSANKGFAIGEYSDPSVTQEAIKSLDGMKIDGHTISVKSASNLNGTNPQSAPVPTAVSLQIPGIETINVNVDSEATEILCLLNIIEVDDLRDDEEYEDICEDIRQECEKFGTVVSLEIPRPVDGQEVQGLGKVYVEFENKAGCSKAFEYLSGRKFSNKVVVTSFYNPDKFHNRQF